MQLPDLVEEIPGGIAHDVFLAGGEVVKPVSAGPRATETARSSREATGNPGDSTPAKAPPTRAEMRRARVPRGRGVAQWLEPELWGFSVVGSNPTTPTIFVCMPVVTICCCRGVPITNLCRFGFVSQKPAGSPRQ